MFYGCEKIKNIDFKSFNTDSLENISFMFYGCENIESLDLRNINLKSIKPFESLYVFYDCKNLKKLTLSDTLAKNISYLEIDGIWKNLLSGKVYSFSLNKIVPSGEYIKVR